MEFKKESVLQEFIYLILKEKRQFKLHYLKFLIMLSYLNDFKSFG